MERGGQLFSEEFSQFGVPRWVFDGDDYKPERDNERLSKQYHKIFTLMSDSNWRTLKEIEAATGEPPASISSQLRHARKAKFGSHTVNKRYVGDGLYQYQLIPNESPPG